MVKNLKKTLALMLSIVMIFSSTIMAYADDESMIASSEATTSAQIEETVEAEAETTAEAVTEATAEEETATVQEEVTVPAKKADTESTKAATAAITTQPEDVSVVLNKEAKFTVETNSRVKSCQWQMAKVGTNVWSNLNPREFGSSTTLKIKATNKYNNRQFRCVVTFKNNTKEVSEAATLEIVALGATNTKPVSFGSVKDTKVVAPAGAFPVNAEMKANEIEDLDKVQSIIDDMDGVDGEVLNAVDITFTNDGIEIQPEKAVEVTMNVGTDVNFDELVLVHINANEGDLDKSNLETEEVPFTYDEAAGTITFQAEHFSTYTIAWSTGGYWGQDYSYNIHYVDTNGNSLTPTIEPTFSNNNNYLIYDIEGYEFDSAHLSSRTGTAITPMLRNNNGDKQYRNGANNNWLSLRDDIYMVYKKKVEPTQGGTPEIDADEEWPEGNDAPQFSKSSVHNNNNTNTITLSIAAAEKPVEKSTPADVIVVFDVSGSMRENMAGTTSYGNSSTQAQNIDHRARLWLAADATNRMANTLLNGQNHDVRMALVSFSNTAQIVQTFTDNYSTFTGKVNTLTANGGTNWEKALQVANHMDVRDDAATFVVFVTDGDPTFRVSRGNVADNAVDIDAEYYRNYLVYGAGSNDNQGRNLDFAVDQVSSIAGANKNFYSIGISNQVTKVQTLTTRGGVDASHAFIASDNTAMENAFKSITESIKSMLGFGDVEITDGITELTHAEMKVMQSVDPESFEYYRWGGEGNKYGADEAHATEWTTREADGCAPATYDKTDGAVHWDMGEGFQLENGVHYVVKFRVWPSQDAYDLVAELNNGTKTYSSLPADEKAQIVEIKAPSVDEDGNTVQGEYALKTNTDKVQATYNKTTKTGDTVSISDEHDVVANYTPGTIDNMNLESMKLTIKKEFEDDLTAGSDRQKQVTLVFQRRLANQDTVPAFEPYAVPQSTGTSANIVLNEANNWSYEVFVAPGFKVGDEILEHGYDFTITEPGIDYHYGLIEEIINPMVVDGEDTYYGDGELLNGETITEYVDQSLTAVNRVKSGIDIKKVVVDDQGKEIDPDIEFTIKGRLVDADGNPYTWASGQSVDDPGAYSRYVEDPEGEFEFDGVKYKRTEHKVHFPSSDNITLTLKTNEFIRFINVPEGSKFEFYEDAMPSTDYEYDHARGIAQHKTASGGWTSEGDVQPTVDNANKKVSLSGNGVVGNKQYVAEFTNKAVKGECFYVYHSSNNRIEKIYTSDRRVTRDYVDGKYTYTFNIVREVNTSTAAVPSFLYGGYYKSYGGQKLNDDGIRALTYDSTNWATDTGATPYTGSSAVAWKKGTTENPNVYTVKGTAMHPTANTVYYLKEVPNDYLRPYIQVVYDMYDNNKIIKLYQITAVDDANYTQVGFYDGSADNSSTSLSATIKITNSDKTTTTITTKGIFNNKSYPDKKLTMPRGYLTSIDTPYNAQFAMQPYFKTLDGVKVFGVTNRTVLPGDGTFILDETTREGKLPGITVSNATNKKDPE